MLKGAAQGVKNSLNSARTRPVYSFSGKKATENGEQGTGASPGPAGRGER